MKKIITALACLAVLVAISFSLRAQDDFRGENFEIPLLSDSEGILEPERIPQPERIPAIDSLPQTQPVYPPIRSETDDFPITPNYADDDRFSGDYAAPSADHLNTSAGSNVYGYANGYENTDVRHSQLITTAGDASQNDTARIIPVSHDADGKADSGNPYPWLKYNRTVGKLPATEGQIWLEFDISSYTQPRRINGAEPQNVIVDWVLRGTPKDAWHGKPFSILSADNYKLYVYHTKEMQNRVAEIVARFVNPAMEKETYGLRVISLGSTGWQSRFQMALQPIAVETAGVQGWLVNREDVAKIQTELARRSDFKEHCPNTAFYNGQIINASSKQQRAYAKSLKPAVQGSVSTYNTEQGVIEEGYDISLAVLGDSDNARAVIKLKCKVTQLEKLHSVVVSTGSGSLSQRIPLETPQIASFEVDEFLAWPKDKVLLLDLGMVPMPAANVQKDGTFFSSLSKVTGASGTRANVLVFVEARGQIAQPSGPVGAAGTTNTTTPSPATNPVAPPPTSTSSTQPQVAIQYTGAQPPASNPTGNAAAEPYLGTNQKNPGQSGSTTGANEERKWKRF